MRVFVIGFAFIRSGALDSSLLRFRKVFAPGKLGWAYPRSLFHEGCCKDFPKPQYVLLTLVLACRDSARGHRGGCPAAAPSGRFRLGCVARKSETLFQARAMHRVSVRVSDLHWAALEDDVVDVKRLIAAGASREARDAAGDTPLREALRPDHPAALREAVRIERSGAGTRSRCRGTNRRGRVSLENTSM